MTQLDEKLDKILYDPNLEVEGMKAAIKQAFLEVIPKKKGTFEGGNVYTGGWNDCIDEIKKKLGGD